MELFITGIILLLIIFADILIFTKKAILDLESGIHFLYLFKIQPNFDHEHELTI